MLLCCCDVAVFDGIKPPPMIFPYGKRLSFCWPCSSFAFLCLGIYTIPEISVIGKTEQELCREKVPYAIGTAKFSETAKGQMIGQVPQEVLAAAHLLFCVLSGRCW